MKKRQAAVVLVGAAAGLGLFGVAQGATSGSLNGIEKLPIVGRSPENLDDGLPKQDRLGSGSLEPLEASSDYVRAIESTLDLKDPAVLRQVLPVEGEPPVVFDTVNVFGDEPGYKASIYHGIPDVFVREHDQAGFPTTETLVGRAWYNIPSKTTVAVAVVNNDTGIAVRVKYFDIDGGHLPQVKEVVDLAVKLSSEPRIVEEAVR